MFHVIARSAEHQLVFRTWGEARRLWDTILRGALSGFVRWRNHRRGERRDVFLKLHDPKVLVDDAYVRTCIRYVHLNPCKPKLAADPLAWPFVTHRDACGLAFPPAVVPVQDVRRFHRSVSTDKHVSVLGTELPAGMIEARDAQQVLAAVSAVTRTPLAALRIRGPARILYIQAARELCPRATAAEIGEPVQAHPNTVLSAAERSPGIDVVRRVLGDPRFALLDDRRLRWPDKWYRD